jgi:hypothetical protein
MNKIKLAFTATAIIFAIGSAFAFRPCTCEGWTQYYWNGSSYVPAGQDGVDYTCWTTAGTCTYYIPDPFGHPNTYAPCKTGAFQQINFKSAKNTK